jgi:hypothetical protein
MIRALVESFALFLVPFVVFVVYLLIRRRDPVAVDTWTGGRIASLSIAGLALAVLGIVVFGLFEERPLGAYVPAHVENGRLVPGRFQ